MKKGDWAGVIIIFALLYLLSRLVGWVGMWYFLYPFGDVVLMVVILFIACCKYASTGEPLYDSSERRAIAKRDKKLAHKGKLDLVRGQYLLNKSVQDIADDLGISMISVKKYIDEIENELKK